MMCNVDDMRYDYDYYVCVKPVCFVLIKRNGVVRENGAAPTYLSHDRRRPGRTLAAPVIDRT